MSYTYDRRRMPTMDSSTEQTANAPHQGMTASPMSNSAMLAYMGLDKGVGDPDLGTTIRSRLAPLRRIAEIPAAEREADTLSEGIKAQTPEQVKQEMGERLGSDFSSVRFHSDSSSVAQADSMGARAWAQGNDVFFGEGGFSPDVAAHELVHTVQQGVVSGSVSQSAPMGVVQMMKRRSIGVNTLNQRQNNTNQPQNNMNQHQNNTNGDIDEDKMDFPSLIENLFGNYFQSGPHNLHAIGNSSGLFNIRRIRFNNNRKSKK